MKRLIIATLALTTILTACSDDKETVTLPNGEVAEVSDADAYLEAWKNMRAEEAEEFNVDVEEYSRKFNTEETPADIAERIENETEEVAETEVDNSERHQFEVGPSLAERRKSNPIAVASDVANEISKELSDAVNNTAIRTFEMSDVIIKVMDIERSEFAHGTLIDVEYAVENTVKERRMVPLERTIIVTNDGTQVEFDRDVSNLPEWDLVSDTKTEGTVSFYLKNVEPSEVESVDVIVPGVDFKRSDDELFTYDFSE